MKTFLQHINEAPMTTDSTYGYPTDRSNPRNPYDKESAPALVPYIPDNTGGAQGEDAEGNPLWQSPVGPGFGTKTPSVPGKPARGGSRDTVAPGTPKVPDTPVERSADGTNPRDQSSTEDGSLMPYFKPSDNIHIDFLDQIIKYNYPQMGDPASDDALDPSRVRYAYDMLDRRHTMKPGREPTPQDILDAVGRPSPGFTSRPTKGPDGPRNLPGPFK